MTGVVRRLLVVVLTPVIYGLSVADPARADNCNPKNPSDCFGVAGSFNFAANGLLALIALSFLLDLLPGVGTVKGIQEAATGLDLITGQELAWWERVLGVIPVIGSVLGAVAKFAQEAAEALRAAEAWANVARVAALAGDSGKAAEATAQARKWAAASRNAATATSVEADAAKAGANVQEATKADALAKAADNDAAKAEAAAKGEAGAAKPAGKEPGQWKDVEPSGSERSRAYEEQVTGSPAGIGYEMPREGKNPVRFDGVDPQAGPDGLLLEAKGPGYDWTVGEDGRFMPWTDAASEIPDQLQRQYEAAKQAGIPVEWRVAEPRVAEAIERIVRDEGYGDVITVVVVPPV